VTDSGRARHTAVTEYEYEPVPGLPERLPTGEEILWQGSPRWNVLARRAFHVRKVGFYFLLLIAWTLVSDIQGGRDPVPSAFWLVVAAALAIGLLTLLARAMARSTLYTITNHRLVMRFGVALPMTVNLPYGKIAGAALREHGDGTGDIPVTLAPGTRTSYLVLWPHVRPWRFSPAEPMLRAIPEAQRVARILAKALEGHASSRAPVSDPGAESRDVAETRPDEAADGIAERGPGGAARTLEGPEVVGPIAAYTSKRA
jgi:Bacterial PH domain